MGKIIGIDIGTTKNSVAVMESRGPVMIPNIEGFFSTPSIITFHEDGEFDIGERAKLRLITHPNSTVTISGCYLNKYWVELTQESKILNPQLKKSINGSISLEIQGKPYLPKAMYAIILKRLKRNAEIYLGQEVSDAILAVQATSLIINVRQRKKLGKWQA